MKEVYVSLTVLMSFTSDELGLDENCSESDIEVVVDEIVNNNIELIEDATGLIVNDIEVEIVEKENE